MWFGFGIITLAIAAIVSFKARMSSRWKGALASHADGNVEVQEVRHKGKLVKVRVGLSAPDHFHFRVRAERLHDRFFKWMGISLEIQTRDETFDRTLYVESDARGVALLLKRRPDLREALLEIFSPGRIEAWRSLRLYCMHKRVWCEFRPTSELPAHGELEALAGSLHRLRRALANHEIDARDLQDRFVFRAAAVLALSTASIVLGGLGLARAMFGRTDILEPNGLFIACVILGALLAGCVIIGIVSWLGGTSRAHIVIFEFTLVGVAGFALSTFALGREMNMDLDFRSAQKYVLTNVRAEHVVKRGRRGRERHYYYLHTGEWQPAHRSAHRKLEISSADYTRLVNVNEAIASIRPGALGFEWVERIDPSWAGPE